MAKRPNILWLMSDQHNANCTGYAGHPLVKTPNLDRIAGMGVNFRHAYTANPICSPSRISFITGQYCHTHRMFGNFHSLWNEPNRETLACRFRRAGYQTALVGKGHMAPLWDREGFEHIRYDDLIDADPGDPCSCHYFRTTIRHGHAHLRDKDGVMPSGDDGSRPSFLPYEASVEHFVGEEMVSFLQTRDRGRPFFALASFQRPHGPILPVKEYFDMYDPAEVELPENAADLFEHRFSSKPEPIRNRVVNGCAYPLAVNDRDRLKRCVASYYGLISMIDNEIGRILDTLEALGELDNTVILYTADHGDFAGEHGLFHKGLGIYESIHRIPFLLAWPGGPRGAVCDELVESVDWYPTACRFGAVQQPPKLDGADVVPVAMGEVRGKDAVFCEYNLERKSSAIRTRRHRMVFDAETLTGELYDVEKDPGELHNVWDDPAYRAVRAELTERLLVFTLGYDIRSSFGTDAVAGEGVRDSLSRKLHLGQLPWAGFAAENTCEVARHGA